MVIELVDYSITGIGFAAPPEVSLRVGEIASVRLGASESRVRVSSSHYADGVVIWGAMFVDPRPDLVRTLEDEVLHQDVAGREARWQSRRD